MMNEPMPWMTGTWWWLTGGSAFIALIVLVLAFFWNRKTSPRCPKCRYDMRSAHSLRCPECGHEARTALALRRRRPRVSFIVLAVLILASVPAYRGVLWSKDRGWSPPLGEWKTLNRIGLDNGTSASQQAKRDPRDFRERAVIVTPNGDEVIIEDHRITVSSPGDVTGDGVPDLVVDGHSGGAHCCSTFHVFAATVTGLGKIGELDAPNGGVFKDADGDGVLEFHTTDPTWNYSISCYACLHHPLIVQRFVDGAFALAPDLMRTDPPSDYEFAHLVADIAANDDDATTRRDVLFSEMIKLTYGGHLDRAHALLNRAWNDDWGDRAATLALFTETLESGPYWNDIRAMQRDGNDRLAEADG